MMAPPLSTRTSTADASAPWWNRERNVPSPCQSVCQLNAAGDTCATCGRSLDEIAAWSTLSDAGKRAVWQRLADAGFA
jgi:uncharacterized protein